jgi:site-specific DNA-methyltransferase (adenine-specific)
VSKPYYQDEYATIYHGDCREILSRLEPVDLVTVSDPPYGVNLGQHGAAKEKRPQYLAKQGYKSYDDTTENFRAVVVPAIEWCVKNTKRAAVFMAGSSMWDLPRADAIGGVFLPAGCGSNAWGFAAFAHCLFYGAAPNLHLGRKPTGISSTDTARHINHPCPKPLSWMKWAICLAAEKSDVVLDPFMGSGTTLVAAKDLGIKSIGIEIEEKYCEIAAKRLRQEVLWSAMASV